MNSKYPDLILLDRDDTIVAVPDQIRYLYGDMAIELIPGVAEFISFWNKRGTPVAVVSNQQGVSNSDFPLMTTESVWKFNSRLNALLSKHGAHIDDFFVCPHLVKDGCNCRKPKPGLITKAMEQFSASPDRTWVIGDKISDVVAGLSANTNAVLFNPKSSGTDFANSARSFVECLKIILPKNDPGA